MNRLNKVLEAIEFEGDVPNKFYNKDKFTQDETQDEYLHMLYSKSYQKAIERLSHYTGKTLEELGDYPLMSGIQQLLIELMGFESNHKEQLQQLAIKVVLDLPEFAPIKERVEMGRVKIDAILTTGELQKAITDKEAEKRKEEHYDEEGQPVLDEEETEGYTEEEKEEMKAAIDFAGQEEAEEKADLAEIIRYGESFNHLFSFNLVTPELQGILGNDLTQKYGLAAATVQTLYYYAPPGGEADAARTPNAALGSAESEPDGKDDEGKSKYTIKARAIIFPFLIHEIIKGCLTYNQSFNVIRNTAKLNTLEGEAKKMRFAPEFVRQVIGLIPPQFHEHKLHIYQLLQDLPIMDLREFRQSLTTPDKTRAKEIMNEIIQDMCQEFDLDPETGKWIHEGQDDDEDKGGFEAPQGYTPEEDEEDLDF
jgi:hypothetical protein